MSHGYAPLRLSGIPPVARGAERCVYLHPLRADRLLKVLDVRPSRPPHQPLRRLSRAVLTSVDLRSARAKQAEQTRAFLGAPADAGAPPFSRSYGYLETDLGWALEVERITSRQPRPRSTLQALAEEKALDPRSFVLLNDVIRRIDRWNLRASDLNPRNFVLGDRGGQRQFVLVDGVLATSTAIPVRSWSRPSETASPTVTSSAGTRRVWVSGGTIAAAASPPPIDMVPSSPDFSTREGSWEGTMTKQRLTREDALTFHMEPVPGKWEVNATVPMTTQRDLSLAYSPGVAVPCEEIRDRPETAYDYTNKGNLVAVISNGTAVLGLGNIGALASKPVMEGKSVLFKRFADVKFHRPRDRHRGSRRLLRGGAAAGPDLRRINLEDIKAPECFIIEQRLKEEMDIPVFHDDQHGTAVICAAGLMNALHLSGKKIEDVKIVLNGAGAAGIACIELLKAMGRAARQLHRLRHERA